jgi:hypothetical protein
MRDYFVILGISLILPLLIAKPRVKRQGTDEELQCCRCIDNAAPCANSPRPVGGATSVNGLICDSLIDCLLDGRSTEECDSVCGVEMSADFGNSGLCPSGQKKCCTFAERGLVDEALISVRIGLATGDNPLGVASGDLPEGPLARGRQPQICEDKSIVAVADLSEAKVCGKRDIKSYFHVDKEPTFTNPGEWPWVAMIFNSKREYVGAATYVAEDTVITVLHKVEKYTSNPGELIIRLGDWNPNGLVAEELWNYSEFPVRCIKVHPQADPLDTLANNIAVLKLGRLLRTVEPKPKTTVAGVVAPRDSSGPPIGYNAVCLPSSSQFNDRSDNCWVAAWSNDLIRQREISLPLHSAATCRQRLAPIFRSKGVPNWSPHSSELCAGGEIGKDTCQGEGGAPLVCLDKKKDQFFVVGLVNYGFKCNSSNPAVYTNLMDPNIRSFVQREMKSNSC